MNTEVFIISGASLLAIMWGGMIFYFYHRSRLDYYERKSQQELLQSTLSVFVENLKPTVVEKLKKVFKAVDKETGEVLDTWGEGE